jgi:hypothetical protein
MTFRYRSRDKKLLDKLVSMAKKIGGLNAEGTDLQLINTPTSAS